VTRESAAVSGAVLTLNAGSSSLKFALFALADRPRLRRSVSGQIEGIGSEAHFRARNARGDDLSGPRWNDGQKLRHEDFLAKLLSWIDDQLDGAQLACVAHRVVHGGSKFTAPVVLDERIMLELEALTPLAPLHQPHNIAAMRAIAKLRQGVPQIACFDTAFHQTIEFPANRFALPRDVEARGVRRYGFHGLSYEYVAGKLKEIAPEIAEKRVVIAHLGSGASLCALSEGRSVDTTMGLTPLDGLVMGTRCGAIDPGILLYLMQACAMRAAELQDLLYNRSGLLGVSGLSDDVRNLLASRDPRAAEALEMFVFHVAREVGALCSTLGGIDALVFTGGIGEHAAKIRALVCEKLDWLGIACDAGANERNGPLITSSRSAVRAFVVPTDEEVMIARHADALLRSALTKARPRA
jgi:acetate kinase